MDSVFCMNIYREWTQICLAGMFLILVSKYGLLTAEKKSKTLLRKSTIKSCSFSYCTGSQRGEDRIDGTVHMEGDPCGLLPLSKSLYHGISEFVNEILVNYAHYEYNRIISAAARQDIQVLLTSGLFQTIILVYHSGARRAFYHDGKDEKL